MQSEESRGVDHPLQKRAGIAVEHAQPQEHGMAPATLQCCFAAR